MGDVLDAEVVADKSPGQAAVGGRHEQQLGPGCRPGDRDPGTDAAGSTRDRQRPLHQRDQQRQDQRKKTDLWNHCIPMARAFSIASSTSGGI